MPKGVYKRSAMTDEHKAKISAAMMGKQNSTGPNLRKGHPGQIPWNKGMQYPEKWRQRMSAVTKAWWDKKKERARLEADKGRIPLTKAIIISRSRKRKTLPPPILGWQGNLEREEK